MQVSLSGASKFLTSVKVSVCGGLSLYVSSVLNFPLMNQQRIRMNGWMDAPEAGYLFIMRG